MLVCLKKNVPIRALDNACVDPEPRGAVFERMRCLDCKRYVEACEKERRR